MLDTNGFVCVIESDINIIDAVIVGINQTEMLELS